MFVPSPDCILKNCLRRPVTHLSVIIGACLNPVKPFLPEVMPELICDASQRRAEGRACVGSGAARGSASLLPTLSAAERLQINLKPGPPLGGNMPFIL